MGSFEASNSAPVYAFANAGDQWGTRVGYKIGLPDNACRPKDDEMDYIRPETYESGRPNGWFTLRYSGYVYCATIEGKLLCTRRNNGCAFWSGNSSRIGVDVRAAWGTKIGDDGNIYQRFRNRRTGRNQWVTAKDLAGKVIGIPD